MTPARRTRAGRELDEDDVRVRPQRGKSRPRSKDRPDHAAGIAGRVIAVDRGRFTVVLAGSQPGTLATYAVKARELGRKGVVVGDDVVLTGDTAGGPDSLARIVRVGPRATVLRRSADDTDPIERVIVANADQLGVVVSLRDPEPSPGLIDRALVAAYDAGLTPLLVLTKADLAPASELLAMYQPLGVATLACAQSGEELDASDVAAVALALRDRVTVLLGHSGVGKSTLVNALVPGTGRATGEVNSVTGRGRHTSTQAVAVQLPEGGWIIDTPGVRSFGLAHVDPTRVLRAFTDMHEAAEAGCPRGCRHQPGAECALDDFAASGTPEQGRAARLTSLRRLLAAL